MTQVLTVSCKLNPTPEQAAKIDATLAAFADACSWVNRQAPPGQTNALRMQAQHYYQARALFGLSANLTQQAFCRVASNRKTALRKGRPVKGFAPTSADYDQRIFSFSEKTWAVSLTLLGGRERIPIVVGDYQRHRLKGQKPTSATLVRRKDGSHYIQIQVESVPPEPLEPDGCLGVDLGRTDIAHTSTGERFCGQQLRQVRPHEGVPPEQGRERHEEHPASQPGTAETVVGPGEALPNAHQPHHRLPAGPPSQSLELEHRPRRADRHAGAHQQPTPFEGRAPPLQRLGFFPTAAVSGVQGHAGGGGLGPGEPGLHLEGVPPLPAHRGQAGQAL
jgi:hypothetical protein